MDLYFIYIAGVLSNWYRLFCPPFYTKDILCKYDHLIWFFHGIVNRYFSGCVDEKSRELLELWCTSNEVVESRTTRSFTYTNGEIVDNPHFLGSVLGSHSPKRGVSPTNEKGCDVTVAATKKINISEEFQSITTNTYHENDQINYSNPFNTLSSAVKQSTKPKTEQQKDAKEKKTNEQTNSRNNNEMEESLLDSRNNTYKYFFLGAATLCFIGYAVFHEKGEGDGGGGNSSSRRSGSSIDAITAGAKRR